MHNDNSKVTTFSSIILLILKELRLERNMHQAQLAEACDKTPSAWTKIELGQSPLTMEIFFRVCNALQVSPSSVSATAERYLTLLNQNGWGIMFKQLSFDEDDLLKCAKKYYEQQTHKNIINFSFISILNTPTYNLNNNLEISQLFIHIFENCNQNNQPINKNIWD